MRFCRYLRGIREVLNHDCHDGGKIAMIFPSRARPSIPLAPYAPRRGEYAFPSLCEGEIPRYARNDREYAKGGVSIPLGHCGFSPSRE